MLENSGAWTMRERPLGAAGLLDAPLCSGRAPLPGNLPEVCDPMEERCDRGEALWS